MECGAGRTGAKPSISSKNMIDGCAFCASCAQHTTRFHAVFNRTFTQHCTRHPLKALRSVNVLLNDITQACM